MIQISIPLSFTAFLGRLRSSHSACFCIPLLARLSSLVCSAGVRSIVCRPSPTPPPSVPRCPAPPRVHTGAAADPLQPRRRERILHTTREPSAQQSERKTIALCWSTEPRLHEPARSCCRAHSSTHQWPCSAAVPAAAAVSAPSLSMASASSSTDDLDWKFVQSFGDDNSSDGQARATQKHSSVRWQRTAGRRSNCSAHAGTRTRLTHLSLLVACDSIVRFACPPRLPRPRSRVTRLSPLPFALPLRSLVQTIW